MQFITRILCWLAIAFFVVVIYDTLFPPISTLMVARAVKLQSVERQWVPLSKISPYLTRAVITAEDGKYCSHHGIDWKSMSSAVENAVDPDREATHGASTITMQVAKNLFLWSGRSYVRKAFEVPLALLLDVMWGKKIVMRHYLNVAEFGPGIFGAEAAARHYFGKSAAALSYREAVMLTAALPNPKNRNPARPNGYMQGYAATIMARMGKGTDTSCLRK